MLELDRPAARQLDRAGQPPAGAGQAIEHRLAIAVVDQRAGAREVVADRDERACDEILEGGDAAAIGARAIGRGLELLAMVEGEDHQLRPIAMPTGDAMQVIQARIQPRHPADRPAPCQVVGELRLVRHRRGAGMARHHQRAAGIGALGAIVERLVAQPAGEEAAHEGVAGAEHVEDLDREALDHQAVFDLRRDRPFEHDAAERPALHHQQGAADLADGGERRQRLVMAARDRDLLLGADDQVAERQQLLQPHRHRRGGDVAILAAAGAGQAPQHRPVIDVEDDLAAGRAGEIDGAPAGRRRPRPRQVRAGDQHRLGRGDEAGIDIGRVERHVGAVLAEEDQGKLLAIAHAEHDQAGQPPRIGAEVADVDAFAGQRLAHEAAHMLVADPGEHRRAQAQPRRAEGDVGGAAAEILGEGGHVLQPAADLLAVEIDRGAADADEIEGRLSHRARSRRATRSGRPFPSSRHARR